MITPVLLDTETGAIATATKTSTFDLYWWAEGNGSCDCNRAMVFGEDVQDQLDEQFGLGTCYGAHRIVAIDVTGDLEGLTKQQALDRINDEYPVELSPFWDVVAAVLS